MAAGRGTAASLPAAARRAGPLAWLAAGALGALALAAAWIVLAPSQLGGSTAYALVVGNSMEPALERGDLAVVRAQRDYRPGDVVLYESSELGSWVLHRIVRVEAGRFVFKGDNNDFIDAERVGPDRIVGRLAFTLPAVGAVAEWIRVPLHAALLVGLTALLALTGGAGIALVLRRGRRTTPAAWQARLPSLRPRPALVGALGAAAAAFALLALVAFTRPETRVDVVETSVHRGTLAYSATVPRSPVYPDGRVEDGEAVFLELVRRLDLVFDYRLEGTRAAGGSIRLDARLSDGLGWERAVAIAPERSFAGTAGRIEGTLDLVAVRRLVRQLHELTGTSQQAFTLTVLPQVSLADRTDTFAPELPFELGEERLRPADGAELVQAQAVRGDRTSAATLALGPWEPTVVRARWAGLAGLSAALLLLALVMVGAQRARRTDEAEVIRGRFGRLLVPVSAPGPGWARATELATIEGLAQVAALHGRPILHLAAAGTHRYAVEDGPNVFLYRVDGDGPPAFDELPFFDESLDEALARPLAGLARRA